MEGKETVYVCGFLCVCVSACANAFTLSFLDLNAIISALIVEWKFCIE